MELPVGAERLFEASELALLKPEIHAPRVLSALLEYGNSADLRWLSIAYDEEAVALWVREHGSRQLSRRSFQFWALYFGISIRDSPETQEGQLWLL